MNLELTDEQLALRDTVRRFLAERASVSAHVRPMLDDPAGTTDDVWRGLAGLGATGMLIGEDCGGTGMTMVEAGVVAEELGAALYPGPWLSSAIAAPRVLTRLSALRASGSSPLSALRASGSSRTGGGGNAAALLAGIADGSRIATVGPLSGPRPEAVEAGHGVILRGEITALPDAAAADTLLLFAEDRDGTGLFAVDAIAAGVVVTPRPYVDQTRKLFDVGLDDVPAQRIASASAAAVQGFIDDVLIAYAADALGAAHAVMNLAVEYAKVRRQFDAPIGSFQAVQHLCVDMYETVELARSGVIHALWAADVAEPAERHLAALRAKAFAARLASVGDTAIQVFGGIGFTWEHDAHLYLKRLLGWSAFAGGSDDYLEKIGAVLVSDFDGRDLA